MGDGLDFTTLFEKYYKRVFYVAVAIIKCPYLAEDITQETFIKAYRKKDTLADTNKVSAWLSTIASRTAIDFCRKQKKFLYMVQSELFNNLEVSQEMYTASEVESFCLKDILSRELLALNDNQRNVLLLKVNGGLKEKEIASLLHMKPTSVKMNLSRARRRLRQSLVEYEIA